MNISIALQDYIISLNTCVVVVVGVASFCSDEILLEQVGKSSFREIVC